MNPGVALRRWSLPATGLIMLLLGMTLPIVRVESFWWFERSSSLLSGIRAMAQSGSFGLAALVFTFSILLPVGKLAIVALDTPVAGTRWLHALGKWSMLDIFVVAGVIAAIRFDSVGEASAGPAVPLFVGGLAITAWLAHQRAEHRLVRLQRSPWRALLALLLLGAAMLLPAVRLEKWWVLEQQVSMWSAMVDLYGIGAWLLASLILVFVVVAPVVHLLGQCTDRIAASWVRMAGEWQMLGVFTAAMLVLSIKLYGDDAGGPGPGLVVLLACWALLLLLPVGGGSGESTGVVKQEGDPAGQRAD